MDFKAIESCVSKLMPLLGSVISESNPIAGLIVMAISKEFNCSSDNLVSTINADPDADVKLHRVEWDHQDAIMQYQTQDKANAREREEKIDAITGKRDWLLDAIAILVVIGFFGLCLINYFIELEDDHVVAMLTGQVSSGFMLCLSYYFGSSNK